MLKRVLTTIAAVVFAAGISIASQIPIVSGPQDPSQMLATINSLIQSINAGVNGRLTAQVTATGTTTTVADTTMATYSLPGGTLATPGDAVRVVCWGTSAVNSNSKNIKLFFGASTYSTVMNGTSKILSGDTWYLEMIVMRSSATAQVVLGRGFTGITPVNLGSTAGAETLANAITIKCSGTTPTAAQDVTTQGFLVEQIK